MVVLLKSNGGTAGTSSSGAPSSKIPRKILFIISCVSFCSNWHFGYQITYINTASNEFYELVNSIYSTEHKIKPTDGGFSGGKRHFLLPQKEWSQIWSVIVSSFYAGTLIGFLMVPFLVRKVGGVRMSLLYSSFPAVLGSIIQLFVRMSSSEFLFVTILSVGRMLIGIQAGCSLCLLPPFIIEASSGEHRPFLSSFQQVFQALATLIGLVLGSDSVPSFNGWKIESLQIFGVIPTLFFIVLLVTIPETPFRLLEQCQDWDRLGSDTPTTTDYEWEFERSAIFYYGRDVNFDSVREEAFERWSSGDSQDSRDRLTTRTNLKGLVIGSLAGISFAFSADDLIDSYSTEFLVRANKMDSGLADRITVGFGILLFSSSVVGAFLIDRFGRKRLLITGLVGTALSNCAAALGTAFGSGVVVAAGFALTKLFIGFGAGAPAWFLTSELVSPSVVCTAQAISTGGLLIATGLSTLSFLTLEVWIGSTWALLVLSSIPAGILALFLMLMLPETKDRTFEEIRRCLRYRLFPGVARWTLHGGRPSSPSIDEDEEAESERDPFLRSLHQRHHHHQFYRHREREMYRSQRLMPTASWISSWGSFRTLHRVHHSHHGGPGGWHGYWPSASSRDNLLRGNSGGGGALFNETRSNPNYTRYGSVRSLRTASIGGGIAAGVPGAYPPNPMASGGPEDKVMFQIAPLPLGGDLPGPSTSTGKRLSLNDQMMFSNSSHKKKSSSRGGRWRPPEGDQNDKEEPEEEEEK